MALYEVILYGCLGGDQMHADIRSSYEEAAESGYILAALRVRASETNAVDRLTDPSLRFQ